jgi:hypothetical protein
MAIYGHFLKFANLLRHSPITDRIAADTLAFKGESHFERFEAIFRDYEKDKMRRPGQDGIMPHRAKYKKLTR